MAAFSNRQVAAVTYGCRCQLKSIFKHVSLMHACRVLTDLILWLSDSLPVWLCLPMCLSGTAVAECFELIFTKTVVGIGSIPGRHRIYFPHHLCSGVDPANKYGYLTICLNFLGKGSKGKATKKETGRFNDIMSWSRKCKDLTIYIPTALSAMELPWPLCVY